MSAVVKCRANRALGNKILNSIQKPLDLAIPMKIKGNDCLWTNDCEE